LLGACLVTDYLSRRNNFCSGDLLPYHARVIPFLSFNSNSPNFFGFLQLPSYHLSASATLPLTLIAYAGILDPLLLAKLSVVLFQPHELPAAVKTPSILSLVQLFVVSGQLPTLISCAGILDPLLLAKLSVVSFQPHELPAVVKTPSLLSLVRLFVV
jgi:hypothetical protein